MGKSPGEDNGNPLQYSCLENPMDRAAWWATVHGVAKSQTRLKRLSTSVSQSVQSLSHVGLFATPWTVAHQAALSVGFSRQECWSGLPLSSPGDLPNPGIEPGSPSLYTDALPSEPPGKSSILTMLYRISKRKSNHETDIKQHYRLNGHN